MKCRYLFWIFGWKHFPFPCCLRLPYHDSFPTFHREHVQRYLEFGPYCTSGGHNDPIIFLLWTFYISFCGELVINMIVLFYLQHPQQLYSKKKKKKKSLSWPGHFCWCTLVMFSLKLMLIMIKGSSYKSTIIVYMACPSRTHGCTL